MAQVSDPGTEAAQAPSRRRAASRHRRAGRRVGRQVRLGWPDAGLDVRYLVYLHAPGQPGGDPVARTYRDGVTLTGLRPGRYVARVLLPSRKSTPKENVWSG